MYFSTWSALTVLFGLEGAVLPSKTTRSGLGYRPAEVTAQKLMFWSVARANPSDIGGAAHGAYNPAAIHLS